TQLCEAKFGNLYLYEGGGLRSVASHNVPPAFAEARRRGLLRPAPGGNLGEVLRTKQTVHTVDVAALRPYAERDPVVVAAVELGGIRTSLAVPMLKEGELMESSPFFAKKSGPSPTSRSRCSPVSRVRPSSPSRTRAFSMSYANPSSSKLRPPRCCRSSAVRPASFRQCSTPCWSARPASARPNSVTCSCARETPSARSPCMASRPTWIAGGASRSFT